MMRMEGLLNKFQTSFRIGNDEDVMQGNNSGVRYDLDDTASCVVDPSDDVDYGYDTDYGSRSVAPLPRKQEHPTARRRSSFGGFSASAGSGADAGGNGLRVGMVGMVMNQVNAWSAAVGDSDDNKSHANPAHEVTGSSPQPQQQQHNYDPSYDDENDGGAVRQNQQPTSSFYFSPEERYEQGMVLAKKRLERRRAKLARKKAAEQTKFSAATDMVRKQTASSAPGMNSATSAKTEESGAEEKKCDHHNHNHQGQNQRQTAVSSEEKPVLTSVQLKAAKGVAADLVAKVTAEYVKMHLHEQHIQKQKQQDQQQAQQQENICNDALNSSEGVTTTPAAGVSTKQDGCCNASVETISMPPDEIGSIGKGEGSTLNGSSSVSHVKDSLLCINDTAVKEMKQVDQHRILIQQNGVEDATIKTSCDENVVTEARTIVPEEKVEGNVMGESRDSSESVKEAEESELPHGNELHQNGSELYHDTGLRQNDMKTEKVLSNKQVDHEDTTTGRSEDDDIYSTRTFNDGHGRRTSMVQDDSMYVDSSGNFLERDISSKMLDDVLDDDTFVRPDTLQRTRDKRKALKLLKNNEVRFVMEGEDDMSSQQSFISHELTAPPTRRGVKRQDSGIGAFMQQAVPATRQDKETRRGRDTSSSSRSRGRSLSVDKTSNRSRGPSIDSSSHGTSGGNRPSLGDSRRASSSRSLYASSASSCAPSIDNSGQKTSSRGRQSNRPSSREYSRSSSCRSLSSTRPCAPSVESMMLGTSERERRREGRPSLQEYGRSSSSRSVTSSSSVRAPSTENTRNRNCDKESYCPSARESGRSSSSRSPIPSSTRSCAPSIDSAGHEGYGKERSKGDRPSLKECGRPSSSRSLKMSSASSCAPSIENERRRTSNKERQDRDRPSLGDSGRASSSRSLNPNKGREERDRPSLRDSERSHSSRSLNPGLTRSPQIGERGRKSSTECSGRPRSSSRVPSKEIPKKEFCSERGVKSRPALGDLGRASSCRALQDRPSRSRDHSLDRQRSHNGRGSSQGPSLRHYERQSSNRSLSETSYISNVSPESRRNARKDGRNASLGSHDRETSSSDSSTGKRSPKPKHSRNNLPTLENSERSSPSLSQHACDKTKEDVGGASSPNKRCDYRRSSSGRSLCKEQTYAGQYDDASVCGKSRQQIRSRSKARLLKEHGRSSSSRSLCQKQTS